MTRFTVVVLPDAEAELREAFLWYFDKSPLAADAFGTEVDAAIDGLEETAADWPKDEHGVYFYHLKRFPYTLRYAVAGGEVTILAVAHQRLAHGNSDTPYAADFYQLFPRPNHPRYINWGHTPALAP